MTFPTVPTAAAARILGAVQANTTATRTFPDLSGLTKSAGDLLVAVVCGYNTSTGANAAFSGWTGGFTEFHDSATNGTMAIGMAYKWSTGAETGTFAVTQAGAISGHAAMLVMAIPGVHDTSAPVAGGRASATNSNADPGSLGPVGWGAEDTLWVAVAAIGETGTGGAYQGIINSGTNYSDLFSTGDSGDVVGAVTLGVAFRQLNADTEDPSAFNTDTSNTRWGGVTIAVRPAATVTLPLAGVSTTQSGPNSGTLTNIPPATWGDPDTGWGATARSWIGWPTEHRSITQTVGTASLSLTPPSLSTAVGFNAADTVEDGFDAPTVTTGAALYELPLAGVSTTETAGAGTLGTLAGPEGAPDAILAAVNLDGVVQWVQDDPSAPGPEWLTAPTADAATVLHVSFPTPSTAPGAGGPTVFQVLVRRPEIGGATDPVVDLELWEAGALRAVLTAGVLVTSVDGQLVTGAMDPDALTDPSGADVELVVRSRDGGA